MQKLQTWVRLSLNTAMSGKNGACNVLTKLYVMSCSSEWLMLQPYHLFGPSHLFWFAWNSRCNLEFSFLWLFLHLFNCYITGILVGNWNSIVAFQDFFFFILFEMPQTISVLHNWNSRVLNNWWRKDQIWISQKFFKKIVGILIETMTPKGQFEICNWPLICPLIHFLFNWKV